MAEHRLHAIAFPTLSAEQVAAIGACGAARLRRFADGETLVDVGDRDFGFFVVVSGGIAILDESGEAPRTIVTHGPGQFSGDVSHVTGNPSIVHAVAAGESEAYEISTERLREVLNRCPELADVVLQAFIARRQLVRESGDFVGLRVIGSRYSQDTFRVREFLAANAVLFTWLDLEAEPEVDALLQRFGVTLDETPVVACANVVLLRNPTNRELAERIGIRRAPLQQLYDLVVVGAGPAGLAAAVYGASEGLRTLVLERAAPGGQAGRSMRIENYLGFPTGLTGAELTERAVLQAEKFGALLSIAALVERLDFAGGRARLDLEGGEAVDARCLIVATGAEYRRLDAEGCAAFEGRGVYYAATPNEAWQCRDQDVVVVGGGNSAGQAAVFLAGHARSVTLVLRGDDLGRSMSRYLCQRIEQTPTVEVLANTVVDRMHGDDHLTEVELLDTRSAERRSLATPALFSFIGAVPRTDWLPPDVETDARGFLLTGTALARSTRWPLARDPFLLETSHPGVFAAGDVRAGSVKRVASAVGEGAMAVALVHEYLRGA